MPQCHSIPLQAINCSVITPLGHLELLSNWNQKGNGGGDLAIPSEKILNTLVFDNYIQKLSKAPQKRIRKRKDRLSALIEECWGLTVSESIVCLGLISCKWGVLMRYCCTFCTALWVSASHPRSKTPKRWMVITLFAGTTKSFSNINFQHWLCINLRATTFAFQFSHWTRAILSLKVIAVEFLIPAQDQHRAFYIC